jgi:hypothetical protein
MLAAQWKGRAARGTEEIADAGAPGIRPDPFVPPDASYSFPPLATFDEILDRPLFAPDRRRTEPPEPAVVSAPPPVPLQVRLEGVARVGSASIAVLRDLTTNEGVRLSEGMKFKDWTVDTVEPERATLKRDSETQELKLERQ